MYCVVFQFCVYVCKCERELRQFIRKNLLDGYKYVDWIIYADPAPFDNQEAYQAEYGMRCIYDLNHLVKFDYKFRFICCL